MSSAAEKIVSDACLAPSTARFPTGATITPIGTPSQHRATGQVGAQNGFGAMIRANWVVVPHRDGGSWVVDPLDTE